MTTAPRAARLLILILSWLLLASIGHAETSVWKISKDNKTLYLAGTFHVLNSTDHPLPTGFDQAYKASGKLIFETDLNATNSPEFQIKAAQVMMFSDGRTLQSALKPATYKALATYLTAHKMPPENFTMFTPTGAALMLSVLEYQRLGMSMEHGVESVFHSKAKADNKLTGFLETPDEQLQFIAQMGKGEEDDMMLYTLRDLERSEALIGEMKSAWRTGNLAKLDQDSLLELREKFPSSYKSMIVTRNENWLPHVEAMIADPGTECVMVGALHLAGPDGLIAKLRAKGYKIQQL
ncbi:hypothetical protein P886_0655 [Alteromonadaceae bacterium 2753L.S.0a.02]|nr:hypothetical protein P886_0655 [Alteromonadaceae bacterium 2753L.S.0a.02]